MQKDSKPGTPKLNNTRKPRNPGTPDNRLRNASSERNMPAMNRTTNLRQRATIAPGDITISAGLFAKRRMGNSARLNTTLSQAPGQVPLKSEMIEAPENELGLLYDKYLQAKAAEILVRKKIEEKDRAVNIQMIAIAKERDIVENKFEMAKIRENEIRDFNIMQSNIDAQTNQITNCFEDLGKNKVKEKLLKIKALLEPMDGLRCEGIILPDNEEERNGLFKSLEDLGELLKLIRESSCEKGNVYRDLENGLNELTKKHAEIECVKKKFDEVLCGFQALVLKDVSHSLSQNYGDEFN